MRERLGVKVRWIEMNGADSWKICRVPARLLGWNSVLRVEFAFSSFEMG